MRGERVDYPPYVENYFTLQNRAILAEYRERLIAAKQRGAPIPELPEALVSQTIDNTWHDTAEAVIDNWIGRIYQLTSHDRKTPFQPGIDPKNPLGLRA